MQTLITRVPIEVRVLIYFSIGMVIGLLVR